jgi:iron-sulfur cluster repair protein YtfE (RIC family)
MVVETTSLEGAKMSRAAQSRHTSNPPQLTLPGQSHTAEGPHDQTGMYVMHHALRRDLARFTAAVAHTPVSEHDVWVALERRWLKMAEMLHHHHGVEDTSLWPVLLGHAAGSGSPEDLRMLDDMEAEHEVIDPALTACREAFAAMAEHPCDDHRNALQIRVAALREHLLQHLAHEEGQALPLLQRTLSVEENAAFERAVERAYPLRVVPFALPWAMDDLPPEARDRMLAQTPPGYGLAFRLLRRGYERREREAFRYV